MLSAQTCGDPIFIETGAGIEPLDQAMYWADYDNDADLDVLVIGESQVTKDPTTKIYRNDAGTFVDIGAELLPLRTGSAAWGDIDNDNDLDFILTGAQDYYGKFRFTIIYRNDGGDMFTDIQANLPSVFASCAWGDFNNDGRQDLALAGSTTSTAMTRIYRNDGPGVLTDIEAGLAPVSNGSVDWGDYDNDGDLDLLVTGSMSLNKFTRIYRNNGDETFTDSNIILPPMSGGSCAKWGDYDGDSDLDVALLGEQGSQYGPSTVYENRGGGVFSKLGDLPVLRTVNGAWGDYDNDGYLDILITGLNGNFVATSHVYRYNGNGAFVSAPFPIVGVKGRAASWGDFDNDARLDFAMSGDDGLYVAHSYIFRNNLCSQNSRPSVPDGLNATVGGTTVTFSWNAASDLQTSSSGLTYNIRIGTAPGLSDVVSPMADTSSTGSGNLLIPVRGNCGTLRQQMFSGFVPGETYYWSVQSVDSGFMTSSFAPEQSFVAEVPACPLFCPRNLTVIASDSMCSGTIVNFPVPETTGCGLITASPPSGSYFPIGETPVLLSSEDGSTTCSFMVNVEAGAEFTEIGTGINTIWGASEWGDYDNDGDLDFAATGKIGNQPATRIYRNDTGAFTEIDAGLAGVLEGDLKWGDYDNDGDLDLLLAGDVGNGNGITKLYKNTGGSFAEVTGTGLLPNYRCSLAWGDMDNDGDLDIVVTGITSYFRLYRNNSNDTFTPINTYVDMLSDGDIDCGDFDNDGDLDFVQTGLNSGSAPTSQVYRNNGNLTFTKFKTIANYPTLRYGSVAWGDYDADGYLDIVCSGTTDYYTDVVLVHNLSGTDFYEEVTGPISGAYAGGVEWGDLDNDGDLDLLISGSRTSFSGLTEINLQGPDNRFQTFAVTGLPSTYYGAAKWGDYDGDGDLDVLVHNKVYRNNLCLKNTRPNSPSNLESQTADYAITFKWGPASDTEGSSTGLTYNLRVGTEPGASDIIAPMAVTTGTKNGFRQIAALGNMGEARQITIKNLSSEKTYYWSVQAVDNGLAGSIFAPEQSTYLPLPPCRLTCPVNVTVTAGTGQCGANVTYPAATANETCGTPIFDPPSGSYFEVGTSSVTVSSADCLTTCSFQVTVLPGPSGFNVAYAPLDSIGYGSVEWGDYDRDHDLDLLLCGESANGDFVTKIYRNDGAAGFVLSDISLLGFGHGSGSWGDYDNDGDLDILLSGYIGTRSSPIKYATIYRNDGNETFTQLPFNLARVGGKSIWGDFNNDGLLDILMTGYYEDSVGTLLYINKGNDQFEALPHAMLPLGISSVASADIDSDGDLDVLLTGTFDANGNPQTKLYRNDGNASFSDSGVLIENMLGGNADWGDCDNDGDLDLLLTGGIAAPGKSHIYLNNGSGGFSDLSLGLPETQNGSANWGDLDNDNDLDFVISGLNTNYPVAMQFRNDGHNAFVEYTSILSRMDYSSADFGDYDNDGNLDLVMSGLSDSGMVTNIYRNDRCGANTPPPPPTGLSASVSGNSATFTWDAVSTQSGSVTYNLRVGTAPGKEDVMSAMAEADGFRTITARGNVDTVTSYTLKNLQQNQTYYWSVQAIDYSYAGSCFSSEASMQVDTRVESWDLY